MVIPKKKLIIGLLIFMAVALGLLFLISRFSSLRQSTQKAPAINIESLNGQAKQYCEVLYSEKDKKDKDFLLLLTQKSRERRMSEPTITGGTGVSPNDPTLPKVKEVKVIKQSVITQEENYVAIANEVKVTYASSQKQWASDKKITVILIPENNRWLIDEITTLGY